MSSTTFLSVGIDVGTTSTHLTISRLTVTNSAPGSQVPQPVISNREVVHQSPIWFTPLCADGTIDGAAVARMLAEQYKLAGVVPSDVKSGAAIITGESAMLAGSQSLIDDISKLAGDFVVAIAGAHLEGVLAARGAGVMQASAARGITICNVDIGGGTANLAVVDSGRVIDTACLGIGGRFMRFDERGKTLAITESGRTFLDACAKLATVEAQPVCPEEFLELLGNLLAEVILGALTDIVPPQITSRLLITDPLRHDYQIDEFRFSGGVAELMDGICSDPLAFGDMGVYQAAGLVGGLKERRLPWRVPNAPIRATVAGAAHHSLQLSGSTITVKKDSLPLRNLPIIRPFACEREEHAKSAVDAFRRELAMRNLDWQAQPLAVALPLLEDTGFCRLEVRAEMLCAVRRALAVDSPLIVLVPQDVAAALGQLLRARIGDQVIVIDGIRFDDGDYIDIGKQIEGYDSVPIVMKTLVFRR